MTRSTSVLSLAFLLAACGVDRPRPVPSPSSQDDTPGAPSSSSTSSSAPGTAIVSGFEVTPAVIHPGDRVKLRDPANPMPDQPASSYLWTACDGSFDAVSYGRETYWIAPSAPGLYAVAVDIVVNAHGPASRVLALCVAAAGETSCAQAASASPVIHAIRTSQTSYVQSEECPGSCTTHIDADVLPSPGAPPSYVWTTRGGQIVGSSASVDWQLPAVGCCTQTFNAALTVCGAPGAAATGFVDVVVLPQ